MSLSEYTVRELREELGRREELRNLIPEPLENISIEDIVMGCEDYLEAHANGMIDEDSDRCFLGSILELVYGPNIWDWLRETE
ncbi:MAG: hypothetical protein ABXS91_10785 [Sulfurimonas sp.]